MDSVVVRTKAQGLRWGKQTVKGLWGMDTEQVSAPRRATAAMRRSKGPEKTLLREGERVSHHFTSVWSLFSKLGTTDGLTVQLLSPPFWEEPSYFSSSVPNSFLPPYKRKDLNSCFNVSFTSLQKTQSCPESWAPFSLFRGRRDRTTRTMKFRNCEQNAQNHYSIFSF